MTKAFMRQYYALIQWLLGSFVVVSSLLAWLDTRGPVDSLSIYDIFPPLGLIAFGLMWTHFVLGAVRRYAGYAKPAGDAYMSISMGLVLALIILHPGLLWLGLYRDGFGLPPGSYLMAYESQLLAVLLGSIGLTIFLAFELKRWFGQKAWWRYVEWAQIAGMAAIFVHAIQLGGELRQDWYTFVWWLYGVTLVVAIMYTAIHHTKRKGRNDAAKR